jgi:phosphopantetheinyl transferase
VTWLIDELDEGACGRPGPVCWLTSLSNPATLRAMKRAPLRSIDYQDFIGRSDAPERLARRRLAKLLLGLAAECSASDVIVSRTCLGAPEVLRPEGWHISVAGRWPHLLMGVAQTPLGVDVESTSEKYPSDDWFTSLELAHMGQLQADEQQRARLRFWCAKEAHAKLTGEASQLEPTEIEISTMHREMIGRSGEFVSAIQSYSDANRVAVVAIGPTPP